MSIGTYIAVAVTLLVGVYLNSLSSQNSEPGTVDGLPKLRDGWWGEGEQGSRQDNPEIIPYKINVPAVVLSDLQRRLVAWRGFKPLEDSNFRNGFNADYMKTVVRFWRDSYNWTQEEATLNTFLHYRTEIEGLNVHFVRVMPKGYKKGEKSRRVILLAHGWPGSFYEFYKMIPPLTDPAKHGGRQEDGFEVIIPSIPGFAFSDAPLKQGFSATAVARIYLKLLERLGHKEYFLQGGDWGSMITRIMSQMSPGTVKGLHLNMFADKSGWTLLKIAIGSVFPSLVMDESETRKIYPLKDTMKFFLEETGYTHIQATKPDTVGMALTDSPVGLAAYILEKFSTATDAEFRDRKDGGLSVHFNYNELLTNVMIYWISGSITSSLRFYKENVMCADMNIYEGLPVLVPTGIASFPKEGGLLNMPKDFAPTVFYQLIQYTKMPRGGHFAAFQEPELLANDVMKFAEKVESL